MAWRSGEASWRGVVAWRRGVASWQADTCLGQATTVSVCLSKVAYEVAGPSLAEELQQSRLDDCNPNVVSGMTFAKRLQLMVC